MAKTIWKFVLPLENQFEIEMPRDAKILSVQAQFSRHAQAEFPCLWALVHEDNPKEFRKFYLAGTGIPIGEFNLEFIGTFQLPSMGHVGHLFEIIE